MAAQLELPGFDPFHLVCQSEGDCNRMDDELTSDELQHVIGGRSDLDIAQFVRNSRMVSVYVGEGK